MKGTALSAALSFFVNRLSSCSDFLSFPLYPPFVVFVVSLWLIFSASGASCFAVLQLREGTTKGKPC